MVLPLLPHPAMYKTFILGLGATGTIEVPEVFVSTVKCVLQLNAIPALSMIFLLILGENETPRIGQPAHLVTVTRDHTRVAYACPRRIAFLSNSVKRGKESLFQDIRVYFPLHDPLRDTDYRLLGGVGYRRVTVNVSSSVQ